MITIPWEVLISVSGLSVHPYSEGSIWLEVLMMVSKKGMEPSSLDSSIVNWMEGSTAVDVP